MISTTFYTTCDRILCTNIDITSILIGVALVLAIQFIRKVITEMDKEVEMIEKNNYWHEKYDYPESNNK